MKNSTFACNQENLRELRRIISEAKPREPKQLESSPNLQHGWLLPHLLHADEFLWRRWHPRDAVARLRHPFIEPHFQTVFTQPFCQQSHLPRSLGAVAQENWVLEFLRHCLILWRGCPLASNSRSMQTTVILKKNPKRKPNSREKPHSYLQQKRANYCGTTANGSNSRTRTL
jgi:hypothetical protein